ncbi:MAG: ArsA-related P-loop ATPase [Actinomycetota bacterium]
MAGKGGVGKTTVTAAIARAAADEGRSVLVVSIDGRPGLGELLGGTPLVYEPTVLRPGGGAVGEISGCALRADAALMDYLDLRGMGRVTKKFVAAGAIDLLATTTPGIKDLLVLGKVKQLQIGDAADLIVVDAPAAGHAITFLRTAASLREIVPTGPVRQQSDEVLAMLSDPTRCQVVLVTLPEETPVNELVEVAFDLEDEVGVALAPIVVNGCWDSLDPELDVEAIAGLDGLAPEDAAALTATARRIERTVAAQHQQIERLAGQLPLPHVHLPARFSTRLDDRDLAALAAAIATEPVPG